jgi:hypothetical protein
MDEFQRKILTTFKRWSKRNNHQLSPIKKSILSLPAAFLDRTCQPYASEALLRVHLDKLQFIWSQSLNYGHEGGRSPLSANSVTISNPISVFSCAVHFSVQLKAYK